MEQSDGNTKFEMAKDPTNFLGGPPQKFGSTQFNRSRVIRKVA